MRRTSSCHTGDRQTPLIHVSSSGLIVFVLRQDVIKLLVRVLFLLLDDVSKVVGVFPEDKHDDDFEHERDVGKQFDESAQLVLVSAIFLVFLRRGALEHEKGYEIVDPRDCDQKHEDAESLSRDAGRVIEHVNGCRADCQAQEAVTLEHLEHAEDEEDEDDELCDPEPWDGLDFVCAGQRIDILVEDLLQLFLLLVISMVFLLVLLVIKRALSHQIFLHCLNFSTKEAKRRSKLFDENSDLLQDPCIILDLLLK